MISHTETRIVPYTADVMYRAVAEVEHYPQFLPWVVGLRVLSREPGRLTAEMAVGYGGLRERYTSEVLLDEGARRVDVSQLSGPFKTLENHWRFTPVEGGCQVEFAIAFEFKSRILAALAGAKFEKALLKMTDAFEARARTLSQQPG